MGFADEIGKLEAHQQLRVSRITTPTKICGGRKCLLINPRLCPVILGIGLNIFLPCSLQSLGSTIADFKQIVIGLGGETLASQVVLSSSSTDTKLITEGPAKNTDGKRCYMVPVHGLSKACRFSLYTVFGVDESESENSDQQVRSNSITTLQQLILG